MTNATNTPVAELDAELIEVARLLMSARSEVEVLRARHRCLKFRRVTAVKREKKQRAA